MYGLTKWPRLLVQGKSVTPEQAKEIIVRTSSWYLCSNSDAYEAEIYKIMGVEYDDFRPNYEQIEDFESRHRVLALDYLTNHWVLSSWIGGPHGWCNPNGSIFTNTYNIGKWPEFDEVLKDWKLIAEAFPYLDIKSELVNNEGEDDVSAVGFIVKDGTVEVYEPTDKILPIVDAPMNPGIFMRCNSSSKFSYEAGVDLDWVKSALDITSTVLQ